MFTSLLRQIRSSLVTGHPPPFQLRRKVSLAHEVVVHTPAHSLKISSRTYSSSFAPGRSQATEAHIVSAEGLGKLVTVRLLEVDHHLFLSKEQKRDVYVNIV